MDSSNSVPKRELDALAQERESFLARMGKHEKARIIKNVVIVSIAFMLHFTAFHGTANLQSSIHEKAGTYSLLSIYGSLMITNIFLPVIVIRYLGCKWTIAFAFFTYMPFVAAQFYPHAATLISGGLFVGLGGAALWCAKCTYLTILAEALSCIEGASKKKRRSDSSPNEDTINSNALVVRLFGLFFFFYQMAQVWGNLISSSVLSGPASETNNASLADVANLCGANFCPRTSSGENPNLLKPDSDKINLLSGIFLGCMGGAVLLVSFGADSPKRYNLGRTGSGDGLNGFKLLTVTMQQLFNKKQLLLIPVTFFLGFDHAIINADLTSAFIACGWGISNIGYAMVCFGVANAIGSALAGFLTKIVGRFVVVVITACAHVVLLIWLLQWRPVPNDALVYCLISSIWGAVNGIWLVQINALSGILFRGNEEAAFSNFRFIEAIGSVAGYAASPMLCMHVKLWIMVAIIVIGMSGYSLVEHLERRERIQNIGLAAVPELARLYAETN